MNRRQQSLKLFEKCCPRTGTRIFITMSRIAAKLVHVKSKSNQHNCCKIIYTLLPWFFRYHSQGILLTLLYFSIVMMKTAALMGLRLSLLSTLIYNQDGCYSMVSVEPYGYLMLTRPAVLHILYIASCLGSGFLIFCSISWVVYIRKEKEIKVCVYCASWRLIFPYEQV